MLKCIFVIIGTIIGAGFASGKEIFTFFNSYGIYGIIGLLLSEILIGFVIYKSLGIAVTNNINSYSKFINVVITKSSLLNNIIVNIVNIFLLISFIVMVAGFSAYFSQEFQLSYIFGALIISILSFFTFLKNINGLVKINEFFIPFLIIIIFILSIRNLNSLEFLNIYSISSSNYWIISSALYASYNLIIVIPILISLTKYINNLKQVKLISILVTLISTILSFLLFFLLNSHFETIKFVELPTIYIANTFGPFYQYSCGIAILGAILTTAISSGYEFLNNLNIKRKKIYIFTSLLICILAIFLSNIGFSFLLNLLYPILGFIRICRNYFYTIFS